MLHQFRVNLDEAVLVQGETLKTTVAGVFEKLGVPPDDALLGADVLVRVDRITDLAGNVLQQR